MLKFPYWTSNAIRFHKRSNLGNLWGRVAPRDLWLFLMRLIWAWRGNLFWADLIRLIKSNPTILACHTFVPQEPRENIKYRTNWRLSRNLFSARSPITHRWSWLVTYNLHELMIELCSIQLLLATVSDSRNWWIFKNIKLHSLLNSLGLYKDNPLILLVIRLFRKRSCHFEQKTALQLKLQNAFAH